MSDYQHNGPELARIHASANTTKFFCHFTGFIEGIAASGMLEVGEVQPLLEECKEFVSRVSDEDANDIIADFDADLLEHEGLDVIAEVRASSIDPTCEKSALNRFLGFCRGIACDNAITLREAAGIVQMADAKPSLLAVPGVREIVRTCHDAVQDSVITSEESREICEAIGQVVGDSYGDTGLSQVFGVANYTESRILDFPRSFEGKKVIFTGTFQTSPRRILEDRLAEYGAEIGRSISGRTDYLVIGGECSRDWIEVNRGTKLRKALELRRNGACPFFVSESQLRRLIGSI